MTRAAAKTGSGPVTMVAIEQYFPKEKRIVDDALAHHVLPSGMRAYVWLMRLDPARDWMVRATEKSLPGIWAGMMGRKRYIDEKLTESAGQIDAVVNLGAGFDTRAYRLPALADTPVWEVDQPENVELTFGELLQPGRDANGGHRLGEVLHQSLRDGRFDEGVAGGGRPYGGDQT